MLTIVNLQNNAVKENFTLDNAYNVLYDADRDETEQMQTLRPLLVSEDDQAQPSMSGLLVGGVGQGEGQVNRMSRKYEVRG